MKRFSFLLVLFSLTTTLSFAQKEAKAKEILDKSSITFNKAGNLSAYFTMNIKDVANKVSQSFDGSIDIKGTKFHIDTPDMETWFNGKTQWVLQKDWDEVNISEPSKEEVQALNPRTIFDLYKSGCNYKYWGEKTSIKMKKVHEVELIPQNKKGEMTKIVLQIGTADFMPSLIHIYYKNGMENVIHINQYKTNLNLGDNTFVFDKKKYPKVEIIDLR